MLIFDIETGPLDKAEEPIFEPRKGTKDPEKQAEQIEAKRREWLDSAALDAYTGEALAIGWIDTHEPKNGVNVLCQNGAEERSIIERFFGHVDTHPEAIVGFNSRRFDLPFLIRRAWILGVRVPMGVINRCRNYDLHIDLMELWQCGDRQYKTRGLDYMSKSLGLSGKTGSGKDFAQLFAEDQERALDYLRSDVVLTYKCAKRMGVA